MAVNKRLPKEFREKETEEEKKQRYLATKKDNVRKAKEKLQNGLKDEDRRLFFLLRTFKYFGFNYKEAAQKTGVSPQMMVWYFNVKDDCRLTQAEDMLAKLGLKLSVQLVGKEVSASKRKGKTQIISSDLNEGTSCGVHYRINGDLLKIQVTKTVAKPEYVEKCKPSDRMYFLKEYLEEQNLSIPELNEMFEPYEINTSTLRYIFTKDDIKISQLYEFAKATGAGIEWNINLIQTTD